MTGLAKLCVLLSILYIIRQLLYPMFRPASRKMKKKARQYQRERSRERLKEQYRRWHQRVAVTYVRPLLGESERIRFKKMIERLDLNLKPEQLRLNQLLYSAGAAAATFVMMSANVLLGYVTAIFIVLGWLYPVSELEKTIERKNRNIARDFPSFYSMVYYQYARSVNIYLMDVIKDYLPNANPDMAEELGVMLDNMVYGEEYALKQLKKRVPLHYIIKFCDIMETRLKGYDNIGQMTYLKNELDQFRVRELEAELEQRERSNARIQLVLIVVLMVYIVLYYLFMTLDSIKIFQ